MGRRSVGSAVAVLVTAGALALPACGSQDQGRGAKAPDTTTATTRPAPTVTARPITAPDTRLALGEPASVRFNNDDGDEGTMDFAITKVVKGDSKDLDVLKNASDFADQTPYYVFGTYTITSVSAEASFSIYPHYEAHLVDGKTAAPLIIDLGRSLPTCPKKDPKYELDSAGHVYLPVGGTGTTCRVFMLSEGQEIGSVSSKITTYHYGRHAQNPYYEHPIVWE